MNMREKIARALIRHDFGPDSTFEDDVVVEYHLAAAAAVLAAMREPNDDTLDDMMEAWQATEDQSFSTSWKAMIDAALDDGRAA